MKVTRNQVRVFAFVVIAVAIYASVRIARHGA